jgi:hypothetical protein
VGAENAVRAAHLDFRRNELATKLDLLGPNTRFAD